ncbi:hypothetical protein [Barnesiella viscericola]|uniref:hypothetical protein n=1 Tax=Barnesiella viscericola TaxID=397865 RepID=UPI0024B63D5C|nr:hypothetical protein [Barnesiella viscericola]
MKHLCKISSWAIGLLAVATLVGCSKEQSELSIGDIQGKATIVGSLSYNKGQAFSNNQFSELLSPAAGVKVSIKVSNASLDPNGSAQGYTTYETTTDAEGKYSIEIPAVDNTNIIISPASFMGTRTLVVDWENNAPVMETEEVVYNINGIQATVSPGEILVKDQMYSYSPRTFVESFGEMETLKGKIGISRLYQSNTQRYWGAKAGINVRITVTYNYTETLPNGGTGDMVRLFGATTDESGNFTINIPVKAKGEALKYLEIEPVSFYETSFRHFDANGDEESLEGVYAQLNSYNYPGFYSNYTFPEFEEIENIVYAVMSFNENKDNGYGEDSMWRNITVWGTRSFE